MTNIIRYSNSYNTITHMVCDGTSSVWIAYAVNNVGVCHLQKVSALDLNQVYFDVSVTANEIINMVICGTYICLLFDNSTPTYIGRLYKLTSPSTIKYSLIRQADVDEEPVDLSYSSLDTQVNILLPGESSATNAKIYRYSAISGSYQNTMAVRVGDIGIVDARSITHDSSDNQWIVTHTDPVKLIRMYFESGAIWKFAFTNIE